MGKTRKEKELEDIASLAVSTGFGVEQARELYGAFYHGNCEHAYNQTIKIINDYKETMNKVHSKVGLVPFSNIYK